MIPEFIYGEFILTEPMPQSNMFDYYLLSADWSINRNSNPPLPYRRRRKAYLFYSCYAN